LASKKVSKEKVGETVQIDEVRIWSIDWGFKRLDRIRCETDLSSRNDWIEFSIISCHLSVYSLKEFVRWRDETRQLFIEQELFDVRIDHEMTWSGLILWYPSNNWQNGFDEGWNAFESN
jgi:hypothetical protein